MNRFTVSTISKFRPYFLQKSNNIRFFCENSLCKDTICKDTACHNKFRDVKNKLIITEEKLIFAELEIKRLEKFRKNTIENLSIFGISFALTFSVIYILTPTLI